MVSLTTPGNIANLPAGRVEAVLDGCVSSPPWENQLVNHDTEENYETLRKAVIRDGKGHGSKKLAPSVGKDYGSSAGQLGNTTGTTFWSAAAQILQQCHAVLRPGSYAIWVCKAFVRKGKLVDFPGDWLRLCVATGFEPVEVIHALLTVTTSEPSLFGGHETKTKKRASFFRRLAEKKGSPEISHEVVLVTRRI